MADVIIAQNDRNKQTAAVGGETTLPFDFEIFASDELAAEEVTSAGVKRTMVEGVDYSVPPAAVEATGGGNISLLSGAFPTGALAGATYTLYGDTPESRTSNIQQKGDFKATTANKELNRLTVMCQQLRADLDRAMRAPQGDGVIDMMLPSKATRIASGNGSFAAYDGTTGKPVAAAGTSANLGPVSTFINGLLDDTDADAARDTLLGDIITGNDLLLTKTGGAWAAVSSASLQVSVPTGSVFMWAGAVAPPSGYVICEKGTIGNASSGGTARANADTENLFTLLWDNMADAEAPVSTGRGASAAADFAANKTIQLPDFRGRSPLGTGTGPDTAEGGGAGTARTHGARLGAEDHTNTIGETPPHHHFTINGGGNNQDPTIAGARDFVTLERNTGGSLSMRHGGSGTTADRGETSDTGSGDAHNNMHPFQAIRFIMKL